MQSARGFEYGVKHIISPTSGPLIDVLLSNSELDTQHILFLLDLGAIYLNHKRHRENSSVNAGDYLRVHSKPRRFPADDNLWLSRIVFQNDDFVIVQKTSGLPVHSTVDNLHENVQAYLEKALAREIFLTHRLDVPTRGLLVYGKNARFQSEFNKLLIERQMTKIYRARVHGQGLKTGILTHYMEPSPRAPKKVSREAQSGWQECLLEILSVENTGATESELRIRLLTGRTHQIRAQLSCEGHPILGDHAYGATKVSDEEKIELEACELDFVNPLTGEQHHFKI